jgi:hypothetical protein
MRRSVIVLTAVATEAALYGVLVSTVVTAATVKDSSVPGVTLDWQVVVNNGVKAPGDHRTFNSLNQPSLNVDRLVVFRGRTEGGTGGKSPIATVVETGMDGSLLDAAAPIDPTTETPASVSEIGLERDGFRDDALAVNVRMGAETPRPAEPGST